MNKIIIPAESLTEDRFLDCSFWEIGVWLLLLGYCVRHGDQGIIRNCKTWSDRRWRRCLGFTKQNLQEAANLWEWEDDDLTVLFFSEGGKEGSGLMDKEKKGPQRKEIKEYEEKKKEIENRKKKNIYINIYPKKKEKEKEEKREGITPGLIKEEWNKIAEKKRHLPKKRMGVEYKWSQSQYLYHIRIHRLSQPKRLGVEYVWPQSQPEHHTRVH